MKNLAHIRPKCWYAWKGDIDTDYYSVSFSPLTDKKYIMYDDRRGHLAVSVLNSIEEIKKYLDICNIPYEERTGFYHSLWVENEYFEKINQHDGII